MTNQFIEAVTSKTESTRMTTVQNTENPAPNSNAIRSRGFFNTLKRVKLEADQNIPDIGDRVTKWGMSMQDKMKRLEQTIQQMFGNLTPKICEIFNNCSKKACGTTGKTKITGPKFNKIVGEGISEITKIVNINSTASNVLASAKSESTSRWTECLNPFYEGDYYGSDPGTRFVKRVVTSKTMKGSLLTLVVFGVTMILTNIIRIQLGGTPAGQFGSIGAQWMFHFFSCLFIAPIIEEPAKMISIKGGYGKHFFFAFNLLEFGGYILMALHLGTTAIGPIIIARAVAVIFHAITTKIHGTAKNQGPVGTTLKLGICILLHFMFNALALKFAFMGIAGGPALLFIIGFMGVAYGVFAVARKGVRAMTGKGAAA